jgi:hypothetical protein
MNTVAASTILEDAERMIGWDLTQLDTRQKQIARQAFSMALQEVWDAWWWNDLMLCAQVAVLPLYADTTIQNAGNQSYFPPTGKFYQVLQGPFWYGPPATRQSDGSWRTKFEYWAECQYEYSGDFYSATASYQLGSVVKSATTEDFYSLMAQDMELSFASTLLVPTSYINSRPVYTGSGFTLQWTGVKWVLSAGSDLQESAEDVPTPDLVETWTQLTPTALMTVTARSTVSTGPGDARWGLLAPIAAVLPSTVTPWPNGPVRSVTTYDPRKTGANKPFAIETTGGITRILDLDVGRPWVWSRRVTPIITGDEFDATVAYAATPAEQLTYN